MTSKYVRLVACGLLLASTCLFAAPKQPKSIAQKKPAFKEQTLVYKALGNLTVNYKSRFFGYNAAINRPTTDGEPAYDYSVHIIWDSAKGMYRMYTGGRWLRKGVKNADGDHVLQHQSKTGAPFTWKMNKDRPEFYFPAESGNPAVWNASNCLEAEVMRVKGTYYMYAQIQGMPGPSLPGELEPRRVDRIVLFTSKDGDNWELQSKKRGVLVNLDQPETTALHHEEMIYVPWDKDGKPFWMYVGVNRKEGWTGYYRIRSADPYTFDWKQHEGPAGLAQLGNQIGYIRNVGGAPLFLRVTFTGDKSGRSVPSMQVSRDGLNWQMDGSDGPVLLAGSSDPKKYKNCYFLGMSTIDGTGELQKTAANTYRVLYGGTCAETPVAPEIFYSEIGLGELFITIK
ncbi:MAG: hypothetical protein ACYC1M_14750 [Armatimonadota bacterium]